MTNQIKSALIVAVDKNYGIGLENRLPWKSKADMQYFRNLTANSVCIMGRNTYESIAALRIDSTQPLLPNRISVVVSKAADKSVLPQSGYFYTDFKTCTAHELSSHKDVFLVNTMDAAFSFASHDESRRVFFIGGRSIYEQCVPYVQKAYVNMLIDDYKCDTFFPVEILDNFKLNPNHTQLANNLLAFEYNKKGNNNEDVKVL
jgi:dihydrofolate reductase